MTKITKISVIIPTYNEESVVEACLASLANQKGVNFEIIVVDDGSRDNTVGKIKNFIKTNRQIKITVLKQNHKGPGEARNLAASKARGSILVFVDADMTFEPTFVKDVTKPIISGEAIGTDSQAGHLANPENYWARYWNMGKFAAAGNYTLNYLKDITPNKKNYGGIYRAILKDKFNSVGGFELGGDYTDDASLAKKIGVKAKIVKGAVFYHKNPDSLPEVWLRARWIGHGKNFNDGITKKFKNMFKFFPLISIIKGVYIGAKFNDLRFAPFKIAFDSAIWFSIIDSL